MIVKTPTQMVGAPSSHPIGGSSAPPIPCYLVFVKLRDISSIIPMGGPKDHKDLTRFGAWRARMGDRMARSSRVFLLGLVFACGVEVLVDWSQTLGEINVLRNAVRQKGEGYVGILSKAGDDELALRDASGLERLSHGVFDDDDAVYVRFTDETGKVVWDKLKPAFAETFDQRGLGQSFSKRYGYLMDRDTGRLLQDPEGFKARVAESRYKDFAQRWTDAMAKLVALVSTSKPVSSTRGVIVYQDRLRDENHQKDDTLSYAIGTVVGPAKKDLGTVIVAFDMKRTNDAVRWKYLKFGGLVVFFVALILIQSTVSRRNRLRLLDLEAKYASAKKALRASMPSKKVTCGALSADGHVDQAKGSVDGMAWTAADEGDSLLLLLIDPDGDGIDAAAVGLHVVRTFLARRKASGTPSLEEELVALGEAAAAIPLTRPIGTLLVRVERTTGAYRILSGSFAEVCIVGGAARKVIELEPTESEAPEGVVGPLFRAAGTLEDKSSIVAICSSAGERETKAFRVGVAKYLVRTHEAGKAVAVDDAAIWARGRNTALAENDIAIAAITRWLDPPRQHA